MNNSAPSTAELAVFPVFRHLPESALDELARSASRLQLKKGESFYKLKEKTEFVYFLVEGRVKLSLFGNEGKELLKDLVAPGEFFGEGFLMEESERKDFAEAMDAKTKVIAVNAAVFRRLMDKDFVLTLQVDSHIFQRVQRIERRIESLVGQNSKARILGFIKEMARLRCNPLTDECLLSPFLTHHDIARLTDTSRQTVTVVLNELSKGDLIQLRRKSIFIPSHSKLMVGLQRQLIA